VPAAGAVDPDQNRLKLLAIERFNDEMRRADRDRVLTRSAAEENPHCLPGRGHAWRCLPYAPENAAAAVPGTRPAFDPFHSRERNHLAPDRASALLTPYQSRTKEPFERCIRRSNI
jgi:hypothetical protein